MKWLIFLLLVVFVLIAAVYMNLTHFILGFIFAAIIAYLARE